MSNTQKPRWTIDERTALHLLNTMFLFSDQATQDDLIARVYNHTFRDQLAPDFPNGRSVDVVRSDYAAVTKKYAGRTKM